MKIKRAALYLRVSTDGQTTDNQRQALVAAAERRGWPVVEVYDDAGISGASDRDKRPGFNAMLKDGTRRRFDVLMVWSIDRLGRSTRAVVNAPCRSGSGRCGDLRRQRGGGCHHAAR